MGVKLLAGESRFRAFLESLPEAVVMVGKNGNAITLVNPEAEKLFGYRREELLGRPIEILVPERFRAAHVDHRTHFVASPQPRLMSSRPNLSGRRKDGSEFPVEIMLSALDLGGETGVLAIVSDITERKAAEEALRKAHDRLEEMVAVRTEELMQANRKLQDLDRLKSEFLASMSHELRTPLNSIIGFVGILLQGLAGEINEEQRKQLSMVYGSAKHLLTLINDLLDLSRIEAGKVELSMTRFPIRELVGEVVLDLSPLAFQKGLRLTTEVPKGIPDPMTDRKRLFQVLLNLVSNAVKFTETGEVRVACRVRDDQLVLEVADTGIGIRREEMEQLFEAFRQIEGQARKRYEGAGLGLHLCRKLATLLGGTIEVESEYGRGSRFTVTIPLEPEAHHDEPEEEGPHRRG